MLVWIIAVLLFFVVVAAVCCVKISDEADERMERILEEMKQKKGEGQHGEKNE
jgi:hypothetical protein